MIYMHIFDYRFLRDSPVNPDIFRRVVNIERIRPVSEFDRDDRLFSALERTAFLGSVMDSNDIEGIRHRRGQGGIPDTREHLPQRG